MLYSIEPKLFSSHCSTFIISSYFKYVYIIHEVKLTLKLELPEYRQSSITRYKQFEQIASDFVRLLCE